MGLDTRNTALFNNIKTVYLQSVKNGLLGNFQQVYATYTKTVFTSQPANTDNGIVYNTKLQVLYPGLSSTDFQAFHSLLLDEYFVIILTATNDYYEICSRQNPLELSVDFDINKGTTLVFSGNQILPPNNIAMLDNESIDLACSLNINL
ncbi:hypothetical protein AXE80_10790 [Wenyingzhuangia fucanilytica]|uniref:Uncharacterized protein n=1 Tax=Wenyingzhuangia fucanilytica TaxID=1790137 RepID=A0A1B1Y7H4_9FLAO|nr:hypothetical protein [Wenyingzhuangia fucanilytica]ANW96730.1 hypothetical protein AXE80_10790 [Wenyingzhuangia fucanilytica]